MDKIWEDKISKLREAKAKTIEGLPGKGGPQALSARRRLDLLLDSGSFTESWMLTRYVKGNPADGIITGHGTVLGRRVCVFAQDGSVLGGSIGLLHGEKMYATIERALQVKVPWIGLYDSAGARVARLDQPDLGGAWSFGSRGGKTGPSVFYPQTQASGVVPQIACILGSCAGIAAYSPALTDFIIMVDRSSHLFVTGPRIIKQATSEEISLEDLGGARVHNQVSGVADFRASSDQECIEIARRLLSFLPQNCWEEAPLVDTGDDPERLLDGMEELVPSDSRRPYDMRKLISRIVDNGEILEPKSEYAPELITAFARLAGQTVGIVANQPMVRAGVLTVDSSDKQARFIRFCDCFNIPIILLVDTPAFLPGSGQEHAGVLRRGAKVLYALCEATVPKITIQIRKTYGGGNLAMGLVRGMAIDLIYLWPISEMGTMGAKEMVAVYYGKEIAKSSKPEEMMVQKLKEYEETVGNPLVVASQGLDYDDVIEPAETRRVLVRGLRLLKTKNGGKIGYKHGNIPL